MQGVPAIEVLVNTGRVFDRIADPDHTDSIVDVLAEGEFYGMQTFDQALVKLVKDGLVTADDARRTASSPHDFDLALAGVMDRRAAYADADGVPDPAPSGYTYLAAARSADRSIGCRR